MNCHETRYTDMVPPVNLGQSKKTKDWFHEYKKKALVCSVLLSVVLSISCMTMKPVEYSFAGNTDDSAMLYISNGNPGLRLVYLGDQALPGADKDSYWNPIRVHAGEEIRMMVHAQYSQLNNSSGGLLVAITTAAIASSRSIDADIEFICPPLQKDKEYFLEFRKGSGLKGSNAIILTDKASKNIVYKQDF